MSFATGGYIFAKQWPYGIVDLILVDGVYEEYKKPEIKFTADTTDYSAWSKAILEAMNNLDYLKIDLANI